MLRVMAVIVQKFKLKLNCAIKTHGWEAQQLRCRHWAHCRLYTAYLTFNFLLSLSKRDKIHKITN